MIALALFAGPAFAEGDKGCCAMGKGQGDFAEKRTEKLKEKLGLSDEQATQIKSIYESKKDKMEALKTETDGQVSAVLTHDQKAKYDALKTEWKEKHEEYKEHQHDHKA
jgi:Spy/CpxP family protein refolding chaperone